MYRPVRKGIADFSVENDSFQLLSDFENQSQLLQDAVIERDQIEKALEGDRLESSGIGGAGGKDKDLSSSIGANAKELQGANELVERRQTELNSAWVKVEGTGTLLYFKYGAVRVFVPSTKTAPSS